MSKWQQCALGDVITLEYGKGLPAERRGADGAYPVYGANGEKARSNDWLAEGPSVVIGRKGTAGALTRVEGRYWPLDVSYYATFDPGIVNADFLFYALQQLDLPSLARGVKPGINRDDVYSLRIPLPPLEEQKRIVAKLDEASDLSQSVISLIQAQVQLVTELELLASSAYEAGTSWGTARLDEICAISSGSTPSKAEAGFWGGEVPWATAKDLKVEQLAQTQLTLTVRGVADGGVHLAAPGDLLVLVRGMGLANGFQIATASVPMAFNQDLKCLHPMREMDPDFFRNAVRRALRDTPGMITSAAHGTLKIETPKLVSVRIPVPPLEIQRELASRTSALKRQLHSILITAQRRSELARDLERVVAEVALRAGAETR